MQKDFDAWNKRKQPSKKPLLEFQQRFFGYHCPLYVLLSNIAHEFGTWEASFEKSKFQRRDFRLSTITPETSELRTQFDCLRSLY